MKNKTIRQFSKIQNEFLIGQYHSDSFNKYYSTDFITNFDGFSSVEESEWDSDLWLDEICEGSSDIDKDDEIIENFQFDFQILDKYDETILI